MKEKLSDNTLKTREKIQILTLSPESWSRSKIIDFFNVTQYQVREARKLLEAKGILAIPDKKGCGLADEIVKDVLSFYEDEEYSRQMPGQKDYVSIGKKIHKQKRLLLCNLNELYSAFKVKYPNHKIGLSKFCALRPKWCVTVSSSGTHTVCVCTIHQNTHLTVDAFSSIVNSHIQDKYRELQREKTNENTSVSLLRHHICSLITEADPDTRAKVHVIKKYTAFITLQQDMLVGDLIEEFNWSIPAIFYKFHFMQTEHPECQF